MYNVVTLEPAVIETLWDSFSFLIGGTAGMAFCLGFLVFTK